MGYFDDLDNGFSNKYEKKILKIDIKTYGCVLLFKN
jgi:hypothetical protein